MIDYLQKGGPLVWLLIVCSVLVVTTFFSRWSYFHRCSIRVPDFLRGLQNLVQRKNYAEALHECAGTPGPVARVVHAAIQRHESPRAELKAIVQEAGQLEVPELERGLTLMASLALIAPMIGLLGTVAGLIDAFTTISAQSGFTSSTDIARGIYQALLSTAAGIGVAIPASIGYALLSSRVNRLMHDMERAGIEIVNLLNDARQTDDGIIEFQAGEKATATRR